MVRDTKQKRKEDENKLLSELMKNPKQSINTIAKHCGFSRQKVQNMIKELEANHVIWGFTTVYDEQKIGKQHLLFWSKESMQNLMKKHWR
jgi:DNA-binding Lrp family transcriptional regulator